MPKFRCSRPVDVADGKQIFEVVAENEEKAKQYFKQDCSCLVESEVEVVALGGFDFDTIEEVE